MWYFTPIMIGTTRLLLYVLLSVPVRTSVLHVDSLFWSVKLRCPINGGPMSYYSFFFVVTCFRLP